MRSLLLLNLCDSCQTNLFAISMLRQRTARRGPIKDKTSFDLQLPLNYDASSVLNFHGRDELEVSEQVSAFGMRKGIVFANIPVLLQIELALDQSTAHCSLFADGVITAAMRDDALGICRSLLGLRLDPQAFLKFASKDPLFGSLVKRQRHLRVVQSASVFEALTWAVMGQQINVSFAVSLRRTFIQLADRRHSSGLWCYPTAEDAVRIDIEELMSRQFSKSKAETILRLAGLIASNQLDLVLSETNTIEQISDALLSVKGIGPWTVNYALLRGYGYADCSLHGDVAVRSAIHRLIGGDARPDVAAAEAFLKNYTPHRTLIAAHLWASLPKKGF